MRIDNEQLLATLQLCHETLSGGAEISLSQVLKCSGLAANCKKITRSKLVPILRANANVFQQWVAYSESKKSKEGYWVSPGSCEVGAVEIEGTTVRYGTPYEAVAEFIEREIGYWTEQSEHRSKPPDLPSVDDLVAALDSKRQSDLGHAQTRLCNDYGIEPLIPSLIAAYPKIKSWRGRNVILFELIRYARSRPEVLELALSGLEDAAFLVRMQSCVMMAYSQREDMIPHLEKLLPHHDGKTREYAEKAIAHISAKTTFYEITDSAAN